MINDKSSIRKSWLNLFMSSSSDILVQFSWNHCCSSQSQVASLLWYWGVWSHQLCNSSLTKVRVSKPVLMRRWCKSNARAFTVNRSQSNWAPEGDFHCRADTGTKTNPMQDNLVLEIKFPSGTWRQQVMQCYGRGLLKVWTNHTTCTSCSSLLLGPYDT